MHIACSIYVLIALSFLCTVLARELGGAMDVKKLTKKVKKNIKNIGKLDTNLEDQDGQIFDLKRLIENFMEFNNIVDGYEYAFIETKLSWDTHEEAAITWGGHLASVHSDRETNFIAKRIIELNINVPYIGGQRKKNHPSDGSDETWKWSDGTNWNYTTWAPDQPNCYLDDKFQGTQDVVHLYKGGWNDDFPEQLYGGVYKRPYP